MRESAGIKFYTLDSVVDKDMNFHFTNVLEPNTPGVFQLAQVKPFSYEDASTIVPTVSSTLDFEGIRWECVTSESVRLDDEYAAYPASYYVIQSESNAFVKVGTGVVCAPMRTYLRVDDLLSLDRLRLVFDDADPMSVETVNADASRQSETLYNLSGQRVDSRYRGIVIQQGCKKLKK